MRVVLVALISALAAIGCEKDPPASDTTKPPSSSSAAPSVKNQPVPVEVVQDNEPMDDVDDEPSDKAGAADPPSGGKGDEAEGDEVEEE